MLTISCYAGPIRRTTIDQLSTDQDPTKPDPKPTRKEIAALVKAMRSEHALTPNKEAFYNKYTRYFNCYAYASGGVGSPYEANEYDAPFKTFAVPGASVGQPMRFITAEELDRGVVADGYQRVAPLHASPAERAKLNQAAANQKRPGYTLVAGFIDNTGGAQGIHFAVRDDQNHWSQKFGAGKIQHEDSDGKTLVAPHLGKNLFQRRDVPDGWDYAQNFVGYYWRPSAGLNVTGGVPPVVPVTEKGTGKINKDVWLGQQGDIRTAKEVVGWSLKQESPSSFKLGLQHANGEATFVHLPKAILANLDGVYYVNISDPSGPATQLEINDTGKVTQHSVPMTSIKRPSPFR